MGQELCKGAGIVQRGPPSLAVYKDDCNDGNIALSYIVIGSLIPELYCKLSD